MELIANTSRRAISFGFVLGLCIAPTFAALPLPKPDDDPEVTLWRIVPSDFANRFDSTKLRRLLISTPARVETVASGSNVSSILQAKLNISETWTPSVYKDVVERVAELNQLATPDSVRAGSTLLIPDLPFTPKKSPGVDNPYSLVPSLSRSKIDWDGALEAFRVTTSSFDRGSLASKTTRQIIKVRRSQLGRFQFDPVNSAGSTTEASFNYQLRDLPLEAHFGQAQGDSFAFEGLTRDQKTALEEMLQRPPRTKPFLIILDDSWPDDLEMQRSVNFVVEASRAIYRRYNLSPALAGSDSEDLKLLLSLKSTTFCDSTCAWPALKSHSAMIKQSLADFVAADPNKLVEVIYMPMNAAPKGARYAISEMIRVNFMAQVLRDRLDDATARPTPADLKEANDNINTVLQRPGITNFPSAELITTDKAVIEGALEFAALYSAAAGRPFYISMSWTLPNLKYPTYFRPNTQGLVIAAAGNRADINIHSSLVQYAARSADPGDVVAVLNSADSPACQSSTFSEQVRVVGLGFPGRVTPSICGTSFSAPRIAWLLAAREAVKGAMPQTSEEKNLWALKQRDRIVSLQHKDQPGITRFIVDTTRLIGD